MFIRLTLKLWKKYRIEHNKRVLDMEAKGILNYESSDDEKKKVVEHKKRNTGANKGRIHPQQAVSPQDLKKNKMS